MASWREIASEEVLKNHREIKQIMKFNVGGNGKKQNGKKQLHKGRLEKKETDEDLEKNILE